MIGRALPVALLLLLPQPAAAHPHGWMEAEAQLRFALGKLAGIDLTWRLDAPLSDQVLVDYDLNRNGELEPAEQAALGEAIFPGMGDIRYFTFVRVADALVDVAGRDFSAAAEFGQVIYRFAVDLAEPVDPRTTPVAIGLYDDEYYINIIFDEADVRVTGDGGGDCRPSLAPDDANPIYYGLVVPDKIVLECRSP